MPRGLIGWTPGGVNKGRQGRDQQGVGACGVGDFRRHGGDAACGWLDGMGARGAALWKSPKNQLRSCSLAHTATAATVAMSHPRGQQTTQYRRTA